MIVKGCNSGDYGLARFQISAVSYYYCKVKNFFLYGVSVYICFSVSLYFFFDLYGCSFAQRCILKKTVKNFSHWPAGSKQNKNKKKHVFFDFIWFLPCFFNWPHCGKKQHTVSTVQFVFFRHYQSDGWNDRRFAHPWLGDEASVCLYVLSQRTIQNLKAKRPDNLKHLKFTLCKANRSWDRQLQFP